MNKPNIDSNVIFSVALLILGLLIVTQTTRLIFVARDMAWLIKHESVFDIDLMRRQFYNEASYMFMQGCLKGVDKPDTAPTTGFDTNSPVNYCNESRLKYDEYLMNQMRTFGRRERSRN